MNSNRRARIVGLLALILALVLPALAAYGQAGPIDPVINEFVFNHTGTDTHEYVEVRGDPGTDYAGFTVLEIEGDSTGAGIVDGVFDVGTTNAGGYWTSGFLSNEIENGTVTLLLVEGFTGSPGDDLDTDDDGTLDTTPWTRIVDDVAVTDGGSSDHTYAGTVLGSGFDGISFTPGGASRIPDGTDTDAAADWMRNDFDGAGLPGFTGSPVVGEAVNTPDATNQAVVAVADVVINEVDADTPGTDTQEFVELYDGGMGAIALDGLVVVFFNGNGDVSYAAYDLDGYSTDANGYFLLGNSGVTPTPDIVFPSNGLQNGADAVAVYAGNAADFPNGTSVTTENLVDAMVYDTNDSDDAGLLVLLNAGQPQVNEGAQGDKDYHSNQRCPNGAGGARNTDSYFQNAPTPGASNNCCGAPADAVHDVQGLGDAGSMEGATVVVEAVVVADFQAYGGLGGYFVQEEDADIDGDPATSEGIFVFNYSYDVAVGDVVRVTGEVDEYYGLTELKNVSDMQICSSGASVTPATVSLPVTDLSDWEAYEGMLVHLPQTLYATDNYNQGRYGEVTLSVDGRQYAPTNVAAPGDPALAVQDINDHSRIQLDDGSTFQNPLPLPPYLGADNTLRAGDTIDGLTGALGYAYGVYEIHPVDLGLVSFDRVNERDLSPEDIGGSLKVASFNVLNYFTTIDTGAWICGPSGDMECRGADTDEEFARQRTKIVSALSTMNADVVGLIEIENNATTAVEDLVNGLNDAIGAGTYSYVDTGTIGTDAIKVALIYKPGSVTPVGAYDILDSSVDGRFIDTKNRPALAQTFQEVTTGSKFTVVVNHLKSKSSPCDDVGDPDTGDGQGNCNGTRTLAAQALADWLATDPTDSMDPDILIVGDLNSYAMEDPITTLEAAGYTDLLESFVGADAYSYVYFGQAGYLDHALANTSLNAQVTGLTPWHINADEPSALDYNNYNQPALYNPDPFRASDHDPLIAGLDLNRPPDCSAAAPSIDTLWPVNHKFVTVDVLGVTDPEGDPVTISIDSIYQDEPVNDADDGNTAPDGLMDGSQAQVRAERDGEGNGRVYYISFTAQDAFGSCTGIVQVSVPISIKSTAVGDGALYDSTVY